MRILIGSSTQGPVTVAVSKDMRVLNVMIGWFQFQHGDGITDSWTIDSVNITLSTDRGASGGSGSGSGSSGTPAWIFGIIAGIVIVIIVALIIGAIVFLRRKSKQQKCQLENRKSYDNIVIQNPLYDTTTVQEESSKEDDTYIYMHTIQHS